MDTSSLQTLIKILSLEQQKGYQNKAVIGGFARFAHHWAREAHSKAQTTEDHTRIDQIADRLREYERADINDRPNIIGEIIGSANRTMEAAEKLEKPQPTPPRKLVEPTPDDIEIGEPDDEDDLFAYDEDVEIEVAQADLTQPVRERRGYAWQQHQPASPQQLEALSDPVTVIDGIGDKRAETLANLGLTTVGDLLYNFPRRYDDYSKMNTIRRLQSGETVSVMGALERITSHKTFNGKSRVEAYLKDQTGYIRLNWFNQPWIAHQLEDGAMMVASGKVDSYKGLMVMNNPELESVDEDLLHAGRVVPMYSLTQGLGPKVMRRIMKDVVDKWAPLLPDHLPLYVRENADLMDYHDAMYQIHFPDTWDDMLAARKRLAYDEIFGLQLLMLQRRTEWQSAGGTALHVNDDVIEGFQQTLPFALTNAQQRAIQEVRQDMASEVPMNRLVQGDVGSGKTMVAAAAIVIAAANGMQSALMAPTSILAEQHYAKLRDLLSSGPLGRDANIALLTGHVSQHERDEAYRGLAEGWIDVVVGTHALIQEGVQFANLGLAIIDEQHRFGTAQRGALRNKSQSGSSPHLLVMTATPIPRTLALTLHADLDLTIIDEMPPGREPVSTRILQKKERERAYKFIRAQVTEGNQAYVICPLVEDSDALDARSAVSEYERLQSTIFPDLNLGLLHGRMTSSEKEQVMEAFYSGETQILVSTTVIEVGIDVPNATVMMIENANRFGLAQLHQLRGRVGRGSDAAYCLLVSDSSFLDTDSRLSIMEETTDGFKLAEKDFEMRGPGDLLGTQQSGYHFTSMALAALGDVQFLDDIRREAFALSQQDPWLQHPDHHALQQYVASIDRAWGDVS